MEFAGICAYVVSSSKMTLIFVFYDIFDQKMDKKNQLIILFDHCCSGLMAATNAWSGGEMDHSNLMDEVRDINLSYLMLAQRMVREDQAMAVYRLGISQEIAQLIDRLSTAQILKLASSPMMLTRFRFDDGAILGMLAHDSKERQLAHAHSAILLAGQPVEEIL